VRRERIRVRGVGADECFTEENMKAVLFRSRERFEAFEKKLKEYGVEYSILDFKNQGWLEFDFSNIDFIIYYPSFEYSSNHPLAAQKVYDNIVFLDERYPHLRIYPDPGLSRYYNDKYRQFQFLKSLGYPIPPTIPLFSDNCIELAERELGYPMVLKNRYGAAGFYVFLAFSRLQVEQYFNLSELNLFNVSSAKYFAQMLTKRLFYYSLIKARRIRYPFLSPPILAQKYVKIDRDLKTVVGSGRVVEAHWRFQANNSMWKMNIDGGGTGVWEYVPEVAIELSTKLAKDLKARWLNIDMVMSEGRFLITEFSPVWHHYAYKEKPSFVYQDDYNIGVPLEVSLNLEKLIVESLIEAVEKQKGIQSSSKFSR
jgi:hypothetical protein